MQLKPIRCRKLMKLPIHHSPSGPSSRTTNCYQGDLPQFDGHIVQWLKTRISQLSDTIAEEIERAVVGKRGCRPKQRIQHAQRTSIKTLQTWKRVCNDNQSRCPCLSFPDGQVERQMHPPLGGVSLTTNVLFNLTQVKVLGHQNSMTDGAEGP